ncbi:PAS domain S-box protein [Natronococcus pandeyae]|uniref:PAS domain S-box protein n=1 Tax=Natronococcus pandeyae TaxID=2055836 RepID=A0A8J8PZG8_9EURY|nr:response regulator [Natronococcus pandeyae]TYL37310.1 PAS domain S-box protein [Natronococcus pandeyae]
MTETTPNTGQRERQLETIDVLLVDDNERWAAFVAEELERHDSTIQVEIASSANEALSVLAETGADCLVLDYQMPEVNGVQLVERIRSERSELPCILVTGEGSEDVAAQAIDAGVTDYLAKDPKVDQIPDLVCKIRNVVERRLLRQAVADGEQRYRTVTEQSRDAILILREGRIVFGNEQLTALTGIHIDDLTQTRFVTTLVHDADRDQFEETIHGAEHGALADGIHDVRLRTPDGTVHYCEYTGRTITYEGSAATMLSIRDVTEKRIRENRLRRERRLNTRVQRALVTARSRDDLETTVVTALSEQGYDLVWIGTISEALVVPRVVAGDPGYLDGVDLSIDQTMSEGEPSAWAARTGKPQMLTDIADLFPTAWRDRALNWGFRTAIALPIQYGKITYGLLAAYGGKAGMIDDGEHEFLTDLAATVGYAIHHMDARKALTANHGVKARLELPGQAHYLGKIANDSEAGGSELEAVVHSTYPTGTDSLTQFVSLEKGSAERFRDGAMDHPAVQRIVSIHTTDQPSFHLTIDCPTPESTLTPFNAFVRSTRITADRVVLRIELPSRKKLSGLVRTLEEQYGHVAVLSCVEGDLTDQEDLLEAETSTLTDKQATALEAAYRHGYFEQPRRRSASEIAETLDISHSTYLQHLRAAQQKVFDGFYAE